MVWLYKIDSGMINSMYCFSIVIFVVCRCSRPTCRSTWVCWRTSRQWWRPKRWRAVGSCFLTTIPTEYRLAKDSCSLLTTMKEPLLLKPWKITYVKIGLLWGKNGTLSAQSCNCRCCRTWYTARTCPTRPSRWNCTGSGATALWRSSSSRETGRGRRDLIFLQCVIEQMLRSRNPRCVL